MDWKRLDCEEVLCGKICPLTLALSPETGARGGYKKKENREELILDDNVGICFFYAGDGVDFGND